MENYRIAVVEAEIAFEVNIDELVTKYYRNEGWSAFEIDNIMKAGLKNLLTDHIPKSCGEPFVGTGEHTAWERDLYSLRNRIIHDGVAVTAMETQKALDAAEKALEWISEQASK